MRIITPAMLQSLLPLACKWAENQEKLILQKGIPLNDDQQLDAYHIGVQAVTKVRLLKVDKIPVLPLPWLNKAIVVTGLISGATVGITFRYGIYIRSDFWDQRRLVVHELAHTMQYERAGGFKPFLEQYLNEYIAVGYPHGFLEQEAKRIEKEICARQTHRDAG